jgi:hypothetical protein
MTRNKKARPYGRVSYPLREEYSEDRSEAWYGFALDKSDVRGGDA